MPKSKKYDKIFNLASINNNYLTVGFAKEFVMFEIDKKGVYWNLPKIKGVPLTLTVCPDQEKMVVAYDTNRIMVFDIHNKCLHPWSRHNDDLFPQNFLKRYNRMIGSTALST